MKGKTHTIALGICLIALLSLFAGCKREPKGKPITLNDFPGGVTLRLNLKQGDGQDYEVKRVIRGKEAIGGFTIVDHWKSRFAVEAVNNDRIQVAWTESGYKEDERAGGGTHIYEHERRMFAGAPVATTYSLLGTTIERLPASNNDDVKTVVEDTIVFHPAMSVVIFSETPVTIGTKWQPVFNLRRPYDVQLSSTTIKQDRVFKVHLYCEVTGAEEILGRKVLVIKYSGTGDVKTETQTEDKFVEALGGLPKGISYSVEGTARVDINTGVLYSAHEELILSESSIIDIDLSHKLITDTRAVEGSTPSVLFPKR